MESVTKEGTPDTLAKLLLGEESEKNVFPRDPLEPEVRLVLREASADPLGSKKLIKKDDLVYGFDLIPTPLQRSGTYNPKSLFRRGQDVPLAKMAVLVADDALLSVAVDPVDNHTQFTELKTKELVASILFSLFGTGSGAAIVKEFRRASIDVTKGFGSVLRNNKLGDATYTITRPMGGESEEEGKLERETERGLFEMPSYVIEATRDPKVFLAEQRAILRRNRTAYEEMGEALVAAHLGEYIAILDGEIYGFDPNERTLKERVRREHGNVHLFTKQIGTPYPVRRRRGPRRR